MYLLYFSQEACILHLEFLLFSAVSLSTPVVNESMSDSHSISIRINISPEHDYRSYARYYMTVTTGIRYEVVVGPKDPHRSGVRAVRSDKMMLRCLSSYDSGSDMVSWKHITT